MHGLSKSRYTAGIQCHKLLWWNVHEPLALELQPDKVLQDRFDLGRQVGDVTRDSFPGGLHIGLPYAAVPNTTPDLAIKTTSSLAIPSAL